MSNENVIANRYARGLAEFAKNENVLDETRRDMDALGRILAAKDEDGMPELLSFLDSPTPTHEQKIAAAGKILEEAGIGKTVSDFLALLIRRGRTELAPLIARAFAEMAGRMAGELTAVVRTARPLSDDQSRRLAAALSAAFGRGVTVQQQVEPGLLAGARVAVEGWTFDGTVLGKLERMRHTLAAGGFETEAGPKPAPAQA